MTRLQELRRSRKLTGIGLCLALKFHPVTLSAVENRRQVPSAAMRMKICDFFGINEEEVFDENGLAV